MKKLFLCALSLALVLTLAACGGADTTLQSQNGILSSFETTDIDGNKLDQSILEGRKLTLVNIWATSCTPCIEEMPYLGELAHEYRDQGVQIIGIVADGTGQQDMARSIAEQTGAGYIHLMPSEDLENLLSQVYAVPTTIFADENGCQVGSTYMAAMDKEGWIETIEKTLALLTQ